ncbi:MAG TPA: hypothetical protein VGH24_06425, partial [Solirubrobacteraceae bacterium]
KGAQCANTGTKSKPPRLRGTLNIVSTATAGIPAAAGQEVAQITDPPLPSNLAWQGYTLVACDLQTPRHLLPLGQTVYYGLMVYVPTGWSIPNHFIYGDNIEEFQFQNIWAAPVILQLHGNESPAGPHVTLALETGACKLHDTPAPGCAYRSNADHRCTARRVATCLPGAYAIPPKGVNGSPGLAEGQWNEIVMSVKWAAGGGTIQTWYRVKGASTWNHGATITGIPTVQWPIGSSGPGGHAIEATESYTGTVTSPFSIYLDNDLEGPSFSAIANAMP